MDARFPRLVGALVDPAERARAGTKVGRRIDGVPVLTNHRPAPRLPLARAPTAETASVAFSSNSEAALLARFRRSGHRASTPCRQWASASLRRQGAPARRRRGALLEVVRSRGGR